MIVSVQKQIIEFLNWKLKNKRAFSDKYSSNTNRPTLAT